MPKQISLKAARALADLTQEELAVKVGMTSRTIMNYENGYSVPNKAKLRIIAAACGLTEDDIFLPSKFSKTKVTIQQN